jgi:uncharacterized protein with WD repeat
VAWSSHGSYLTTIHAKGAAVWGGPQWTQIRRFPHNGVKQIEFSPQEKYLVTYAAANKPNTVREEEEVFLVALTERTNSLVCIAGFCNCVGSSYWQTAS